ncbi:MAG: DUF2442 domain-containing protein [Planctomycetota bacterium]
MSTSAVDITSALAEHVVVSNDTLTVSLSDGRTLSVPLGWYPRLMHASARERKNWRLIGKGQGVQWPDVEEDISVSGLLFGNPSRECHESFRNWLASRKARPTRRCRRRGKARR